ncbi:hypothetical protein CGSMWGv00703Bmash_00884 [Gardnerella pickettii 00703Bmash]|nr:hypothetical protein CGSMWGv00703Bmash_00884 [Gardnerella pickettii 00703Bmash]EIK85951.1 hypothetical protein CGSMWGv00703C2mash_02306 [Gardnerella pickettii 00703C2mash]
MHMLQAATTPDAIVNKRCVTCHIAGIVFMYIDITIMPNNAHARKAINPAASAR